MWLRQDLLPVIVLRISVYFLEPGHSFELVLDIHSTESYEIEVIQLSMGQRNNYFG